MGGWVVVENEINANSVEVEVEAELGNYITQVTCLENKERKCLYRSSTQNTGE